MSASFFLRHHLTCAVVGDRHTDNRFQGQCHGRIGPLFREFLFLHDAEETTFRIGQAVEQTTYLPECLFVLAMAKIQETGVATPIETSLPLTPWPRTEQSGTRQPYVGTEGLAVITKAVIARDDDHRTVNAVRQPQVLEDGAHGMVGTPHVLQQLLTLCAQGMLAVVGGDKVDGHQPRLIMVHQIVGHRSGTAITLQRPSLVSNGIQFSTGILFQFVEDTHRGA